MRLVLILFLSINSLSAQTFQWALGAGAWADDYPTTSTFDENGNVYTTGHVNYGAKFATYEATEWGFFLVKQNKNGDVLWVKFSTSSYDANGTDICVDSKSNVYVVGSFHYNLNLGDTVLIGGAQGPMSSMFLIKYDKDGNRIWAKNLGIYGMIGEGRLAIDKQDNVYLAGAFIYSLDLGNGVNLTGSYITYWPYADVFLCKFNSDGFAQWGFSVSSSLDDNVVGVEVSNDQNVYLVGQYSTKELNIQGKTYDFGTSDGSFVIQCSSSGYIQNALPIKATVADFKIDNQNNLLIIGAGHNPTDLSYIDTFVSKYNSDFSLFFTKTFATYDFTGSHKIATNGKDIFIAGGFNNGLAIDYLNTTQKSGSYIIKLSELGYPQWMKTISSSNYVYKDNQINSINALQNNLVVAGTYNGTTFNLDGHILINNSGNGDADIFIAAMIDSNKTICPPKSSSLTITNEIICQGDSSTINATLSTSPVLNWYRNSLLYHTGYEKKLSTTLDGKYNYIAYKGSSCEDTSNYVSLAILEYPTKTITIDSVLPSCNKPVKMLASTDNKFSYQWFQNDQKLVSEINSSLVSTVNGTYYCLITNEGLCSTKTDAIELLILPKEEYFLPDTIWKCKLKDVSLSATGLKYNNWDFEWTTGDQKSKIDVKDEGNYGLALRKGGCSYYNEVVVKNYNDLWFPNVITPNNDGKNDFYVIRNLTLPVSFSVCNRWGEIVFEDDQYNNNWSAENVPSGVYFYTVKDVSGCSGTSSKGWLTVIK